MRNALKRELSVLCGLGALASLLTRRSHKTTMALSALAAGLYTASRGEGDFDYRGRSVFITGGSRGLGLALAKQAARRGANVTIIARQADEIERAKDIIISECPKAQILTFVADVTSKGSFEAAFQAAREKFGGIDVLINNAGAMLVGPFEAMEREDFSALMNLHLYAVVEATKLVIPHFRERGEGRIVNICSLGGKVAVPHMTTYDASKFALAGFSQGVSAELARENIFVTTVYPPPMRTGSAIQAVFKGDHLREFTWFQAAANLPLTSVDVDHVATKVLRASASGDRELIPSAFGLARVWGSALFPELMESLTNLISRNLPKEDCKHRLTGEQSRRLAAREGVALPDSDELQRKNNQLPGNSAEFNLGLH